MRTSHTDVAGFRIAGSIMRTSHTVAGAPAPLRHFPHLTHRDVGNVAERKER